MATTTADMGTFAPNPPAGSTRGAAAVRVRDPRLDFFRGIAMFIILIAHTPGNWWVRWIPARFGFSDATEIFVFCSGMASAIAFGATFARAGWALGTARVLFRIWQVYWAHIGLFFLIAMMLATIDTHGSFDKSYINGLNLRRFFEDPATQIVGLFTLTYVPNYFDILPMYLVILAMLPLVMAVGKVSKTALAGILIVLWFFAQHRILDAIGLGGLALELPAEPWSEREWFFNPFAWQLIFFTGFAFMAGWLPKPPVHVGLIALASVVVLANVAGSHVGIRMFGQEIIDWRVANRIWITKTDFGLFRFLHFLSLAYLAWVLVGPGGSRLKPSGSDPFSTAWRWIVAQITKVGQQSLAIFVFSMAFARVIGFTLDQVGRTTATVTLANVIGVVTLVVVAYTVAWFKGAPWRKRA
ncbi:MAG: OpgC domain-containing protein [Pseudomonadota bacterium]